MRKSGVFFICIGCFLAGLVPFAAAVDTYPAIRENFVLGLGLGWGNAGADLTIVEKVDRENGIIGNINLGWAVQNAVVLGFDIDVWSQFFDNERWVFNLGAVTVKFFPFDKGAYVAGGIGFGTARIEVDQGGGPNIQQDRAGVGYSLAGGYEWWIYDQVALGPQVKWAYMDLNGDVARSADYFSITVQLTWYKPDN